MTPEGQLLHDILATHGARPDCTLIRINVVRAKDPFSGRMVTSCPSGWPDIYVLADHGRTGFMECKSATGRLSESQRNFHALLARRGHRVATIRSLDEATRFLEHLCSP